MNFSFFTSTLLSMTVISDDNGNSLAWLVNGRFIIICVFGKKSMERTSYGMAASICQCVRPVPYELPKGSRWILVLGVCINLSQPRANWTCTPAVTSWNSAFSQSYLVFNVILTPTIVPLNIIKRPILFKHGLFSL